MKLTTYQGRMSAIMHPRANKTLVSGNDISAKKHYGQGEASIAHLSPQKRPIRSRWICGSAGESGQEHDKQ